MEDGKGEWILDWSEEEAELCWYDLLIMWQYERLQENLRNNRFIYSSPAGAQTQSELELVETSVILGW